MTETEAMYKTGEPLPECETGSVERMLEAAIVWSERLEPRNSTSMLGFKVCECEEENPIQTMQSQTKLLRNILAKMQQQALMDRCECQYLLKDATLTAAEAKRIEPRVFSGERGEFAELNPSITERKKQAALNEWPSDKCVGMYMQCPYCDEVVLATTKLERRRKG